MKNEGKGSKADGLGARKDRKSGSGMKGSPKKGGRGGRYTWDGAGGYSAEELGKKDRAAAVDANDPKFDDIDPDDE